MTDNKSIVPTLPPLTGDESWDEIVNRLTSELIDADKDIPDKVVQATELLLAGHPTYMVANRMKMKVDTLRRWISMYPTMAQVLADGKKMLSKWRMAKLEQQFAQAVARSEEVLKTPLDGRDEEGNKVVDPKILTVVAAQARYIIGLFAGQQTNVTVTHEMGDSVMKAKTDALDYLAEQLAKQREGAAEEPIEAVYRVVDPKLDNNGPYLNENGEPFHGRMGVLDANEEGLYTCHICGEEFKHLNKHVLFEHALREYDYEVLFMLAPGSLAKASN